MKVVRHQWSVLSKSACSVVLTCSLLTICSSVEAQQSTNVPRIGYLSPRISSARYQFDSFRQGLRDLGYIEGQSINIEKREGQGRLDSTRPLAAELVRLKLDVIVAVGSAEITAAKEATAAIPIVMVPGGDPVGSGYVASLARPGGNITELALLRPELSGKRLELLKEAVPKLSRVVVFASSGSADYSRVLKEIETAARPLGVTLQSVNISSSPQYEIAFQNAAKGRADAILFRVPGPSLSDHRTEVAALAIKNGLPVIYESTQEVDAGGLMSYGVNAGDLYRRAATFVDKILKGAKPADIPIEQPTKYELAINLNAAKQIGLTIPPNLLARADKVIK
jgi:putative tryptophan/tyrosine transport system substrate-binding protein